MMSSPATGKNAATTSTRGSGARTTGTTTRRDNDVIPRFDRVERAAHWTTAALFGILMLTGAVLYAGPFSAMFGRRELFRQVHVYAGILLLVPILLGAAGRWGAQLRRDVRTRLVRVRHLDCRARSHLLRDPRSRRTGWNDPRERHSVLGPHRTPRLVPRDDRRAKRPL